MLVLKKSHSRMASNQMSASLKERLKRAGRSYKSPAAVKKQRTESPGTDLTKMSPSKLDNAGLSLGLPHTPQNQSVRSNLDTSQLTTPRSQRDNLNPVMQLSPTANTIRNVSYSSIPGVTCINSPTTTPRNRQVKEITKSGSDSEQKVLNFNDEVLNTSNNMDVKLANMKPGKSGSEEHCEVYDNKHPSLDEARNSSTLKGSASVCDNVESLRDQRNALKHRITAKEEVLRKLSMVKMYRAKNNLEDLEKLIQKWLHVSQDALQELWDLLDEPRPTLTEMIDHFQIDHKFINYSAEEETFIQKDS